MSLILLRFARPQCLAATHLSSPEVGNGLSWPKPQCTCNAMVTSQAQHSTHEGVLRSNSACSMLMSDDLRLPRRGIEPRPSEFRDIGSTSRPSPLPRRLLVHIHDKKQAEHNTDYLHARSFNFNTYVYIFNLYSHIVRKTV